jgi:hypothetical protein
MLFYKFRVRFRDRPSSSTHICHKHTNVNLARCAPAGKAALVHRKHELSMLQSFKACMRRDATLMWRNRVRPHCQKWSCLLLPAIVWCYTLPTCTLLMEVSPS